ncbi:hypothetical protein AB1Y20_006462 [Prymnesium parvum]|uniref:Alpha-ketoglutarate-dependent dioxygenase FTO n=1 Tax=Prymnesium parvum TaxID=97485 RepID=A0AB34J0P5_PRYPA
MSNWAAFLAKAPPQPALPSNRAAAPRRPRRRDVPSAPSARPPSRPPPVFPGAGLPPLLEPSHPSFAACLRVSYAGLALDAVRPSASLPPPPPSRAAPPLPAALTARVRASLESLRAAGHFHHDIVLAPHKGASSPSPTLVRRLLVGAPGITYKYLGLRTFAHPWDGKRLAPLRELNDALVHRTRQLLGEGGGACEYNLSLVNLLLPGEATGGALRDKRGARLGGRAEQAVSWHADSSVQPFSSIAVLNLAAEAHEARGGTPWKVAVKCVGAAHEEEGGTPALALPLHDGDVYYMLDDFNHHHHHAVLAGSYGRYSSTHRVALTSTDTWEYIWRRVEPWLHAAPPHTAAGWSPLLAASLRACEEVHSEVEFEWLRPWAAQGAAHAASHAAYWAEKIASLHAAWARLEARTAAHLALLCAAPQLAEGEALLPEGVRAYDVMLALLGSREGEGGGEGFAGREGWRRRLAARAYEKAPPLQLPRFSTGGVAEVEPRLAALRLQMPAERLQEAIAALRKARGAFAARLARGAPKPAPPPALPRKAKKRKRKAAEAEGAAGA